MEAASAASRLPASSRERAFERECARLRPLGEAYAMRRFGGQLSRQDAEDAVAEVLIRLHRQVLAGKEPRNLRAAFLTGVRNASIDILRSREAKPTVALEAAADAVAPAAMPAEHAEAREDSVRLQEALKRMRGNYREAILLRFGLGLSVPEIASQLQISLPAAKKLMLRATRQVRERMTGIEGEEFCPEMRELARRSLFEKEASGIASEPETEVLRAHFAHCGPCRSFLAALHERLHDLGSSALLGLGAGWHLDIHISLVERLSHWLGAGAQGLQAGVEKARHLAFRVSAPLQSGDGAAGALLGGGQKVAAICGAGAAATATCLLTGAVGPGLGATAPPAHAQHSPPPKVKRLASPSPQLPATTAPALSAEPGPEAQVPSPSSAPPREPTQTPSPSSPAQSPAPPAPEFGIEGGSSSGSSAAVPVPSGGAARSTGESSGGESGAAGSTGGSSGGSGGGSVGFQG
jgi:RNA polymerase sigma factor (sigma-70 family)